MSAKTRDSLTHSPIHLATLPPTYPFIYSPFHPPSIGHPPYTRHHVAAKTEVASQDSPEPAFLEPTVQWKRQIKQIIAVKNIYRDKCSITRNMALGWPFAMKPGPDCG